MPKRDSNQWNTFWPADYLFDYMHFKFLRITESTLCKWSHVAFYLWSGCKHMQAYAPLHICLYVHVFYILRYVHLAWEAWQFYLEDFFFFSSLFTYDMQTHTEFQPTQQNVLQLKKGWPNMLAGEGNLFTLENACIQFLKMWHRKLFKKKKKNLLLHL